MNIDRARELSDAKLIDETFAEAVCPTLKERFWTDEDTKLNYADDCIVEHEPSRKLWLLGDLDMAQELQRKAAEHRLNGDEWKALKENEKAEQYFANAGKQLLGMINDNLRRFDK